MVRADDEEGEGQARQGSRPFLRFYILLRSSGPKNSALTDKSPVGRLRVGDHSQSRAGKVGRGTMPELIHAIIVDAGVTRAEKYVSSLSHHRHQVRVTFI